MDMYLIPLNDSHPEPVKLSNFTTLGYSQSNTISLFHPSVKEKHAHIEKRNEDFILKDLSSKTGTFVNQVQILEAKLKVGDFIQIGPFEFRADDLTASKSSYLLETKNEKWSQQISLLANYSKSELPVLLLGPSGAGKEVLAKSIHENSYRRSGPLVTVNCSALSESLVESELFGHVKGSFTGSTQDRKGAFDAARGGTLFLDEIGDLPLSLQPKLLRALENKEIRPVGCDKTIKTNVRIIAATHQDLKKLVLKKTFRKDLFFRLNVIQINLPSLHERIEDFEPLLFRFAKESRVRFSNECVEILKKHPWPGNIRELKNFVYRASAMFPQETIRAEHITKLLDQYEFDSLSKDPESNSVRLMKEIEKQVIKERLLANEGNQRKTAQELGMPKSTLHDRIKQYQINITDLLNFKEAPI